MGYFWDSILDKHVLPQYSCNLNMKTNILGRRVGHILTGALNSIQLSFCFNFNI